MTEIDQNDSNDSDPEFEIMFLIFKDIKDNIESFSRGHK